MSSKAHIPFTANPEKRDVAIKDAYDAVQSAVVHLKKAQRSAANWGEYETLQYFARELSEFISSDHDEAGFGPTYRNQTGHVKVK